jgi:purine nucleosidase
MFGRLILVVPLIFLLDSFPVSVRAQEPASPSKTPEKIIIDTDIGTDIDDAFAVALALRSPEVKIVGITTASGDTEARAKILDRMLGETDYKGIPVLAGVPTRFPDPTGAIGPQSKYGEKSRFAHATHASAVDFSLEEIHKYPGEITLVAIGPLTNLGGVIDKDPQQFRRVKRVVLMGGGVGSALDGGWGIEKELRPEYNILGDIHGAQKLFQSGVPLYVMPLNSTANLKLEKAQRDELFAKATPLTESLGLQYLYWGNPTPILYDAMAVGYVIDPHLCPVEPMHIVVDDSGVTRSQEGAPNAQVCLRSDPNQFFRFYLSRFE